MSTRSRIKSPRWFSKQTQDARPRGFVLRAQDAALELAVDWQDLSREQRLERLSFIRELAEIAMEQVGGHAYWQDPRAVVEHAR